MVSSKDSCDLLEKRVDVAVFRGGNLDNDSVNTLATGREGIKHEGERLGDEIRQLASEGEGETKDNDKVV